MKKVYEEAFIEIVEFNKEDIIVTSGTYSFGSYYSVEKTEYWDDDEEE